jgi:hypothetical protein
MHLIIARPARARALRFPWREQKQESQNKQDDGAPDHEHLPNPFTAGTSLLDCILHLRKVDPRKLQVHRDVAIGLRRIAVRFPGAVNWRADLKRGPATPLTFIHLPIPVNIGVASPDQQDTLKQLIERGF